MLELEQIDWKAAIKSLEAGLEKQQNPTLNHHLANCYSLSALFKANYSTALSNIKQAKTLEPFSPLHQYRLILMLFQFGQWEEGRVLLEQLEEKMPDSLLLKYLKSMSTLRIRGKEKRAGIIAKDLIRTKKDFHWAKFLAIDASLRIKLIKGLEKGFRTLPKEKQFQAAWLDLYTKIIILYGKEGIQFVEKNAKDLRLFKREEANNRVQQLLNQIIFWSTATEVEFKDNFASLTPDTKTEQIALLCQFNINRKKKNPEKYLLQIKTLQQAFPERKALKRLYAANLNQVAVEKASEGKLNAALALIEVCQKLEPYNLINWQNKATIFTLLREEKSYHDAWEALDRYHFRLALLGRWSQKRAKFLAKRFRMFAQQARSTPSAEDNEFQLNYGILKKEVRKNSTSKQKFTTVNQQVIDSDVEQLRQWLHYSQAELTFLHLSLGTNPVQFLLGYADELTGKIKLKALLQLSKSLAILVEPEGDLLQQKIEAMWNSQWEHFNIAYTFIDSPDILFIKQTHLQAIADVSLLCYNWEPKANQETIVQEIVKFLEVAFVFLDAELLFENKEESISDTILFLRQIVIEVLDLEQPKTVLSSKEITKLSKHLSSELLINFSIGTYQQLSANRKSAARKAVQILERARNINPQSPKIEYFIARYFLISGFYEASKKAIARFYQIIPNKEAPYVKEIEDIQKALEELEDKGQKYDPLIKVKENTKEEKVEIQLEKLLEDIEQFPTSTQIYEQIVYLYIRFNQYEQAINWAQKAIARCLSRQGQIKARLMNMETLAFEYLKEKYQEEIELYAKGVHTSLRQVLEKNAAHKEQPYLIDFLLGQCFLKDRNPAKASHFYQTALEKCDKQLHYGILKILAKDIEEALLTTTRKVMAEALAKKDFELAFLVITESIAKLEHPEKGLLLLANSLLKAITDTSNHTKALLNIPKVTVNATWNSEWITIFSLTSPLDILKGVLDLSLKYNQTNESQNKKIQSQIIEIEAQQQISNIISKVGQLTQTRNFEEALEVLEGLDGFELTNSIFLRQKIGLLLHLRRFEEADLLCNDLKASKEEQNQSFIDSYTNLKFTQATQHAQDLLRKGAFEKALELLNTLQAQNTIQSAELAYCKAFGLTLKGYQQKKEGKLNSTIDLLTEAIDEIEPYMGKAKLNDSSHIEKLYDKLTKDLHDLKTNRYE